MPGFSKFSPNCCCVDCTLFADAFDRDAIGSNWSVQTGTWTIATTGGGELTTSSSNAEIDQGAGGDGGKATATVNGSGQMQVGLGAAGAYVAAELDTSGATFSIVVVSGGTRTVLRQCPASDSTATISLCSDIYVYGTETFRIFTASLNGTALLTWGDAVGPCESFSGVLATGTISGSATFTNFTMANASCENSSCPQCAQCCWLPGGSLPSQVQVVISGLGPAASGIGLTPCTDAQCDALNGTYILDQQSDCTASYVGCPDIPCCACYELTGLDLPCDSVDEPITTIRFLAFNSEGGSCQEPGQCNLYVELCIASGFVAFHFDLGLGPAPSGFFPSEADGTYSVTAGDNPATLLANNFAASPTPGGLRCQHDSLDDPTPATAVVTPV